VAFAPTFQLAVVALIPVGVAAGAFLAVDWALMTDIIPKVTTGRYMGISNVGTTVPVGSVLPGETKLDQALQDMQVGSTMQSLER
jgi:predicted MFS family arabinose efflux permease